MSVKLNNTLGEYKVEQMFECDNIPPYTLAVFHKQTKQLMFGADANIDPITGSLCLDNGMYKGLHRQYWDLSDERKSGTAGGDFPVGRWIPRTLNNMDGVSGMGVRLMPDNQTVKLDPGTYHISARAPAFGVGDHQIRLENVSKDKGVTEKYGSNASSASDEQMTDSCITGYRLTVSKQPQTFQLQHKCTGGRPHDGLGKPNEFSESMEVYATMTIHRLN